MSLAAILALGLAVLGTFKLGLIAPSIVQPVLLTAYVAFLAGMASYYFAVRWHFRKFYRADARRGSWSFCFDEYGILDKSQTTDVRLAWRAISAVEDCGRMVLFLFGAQGIGIPSRVFNNNAARVAFVAVVAARIKAAAEMIRPSRLALNPRAFSSRFNRRPGWTA
jgi:hypothetical protein